MRKYILYIIACLAVILLVTACVSGRKSVKRISVAPDSCILLPDTAGYVVLETTFQLPGNYMSKRSRLVIVPQLLVNGKVSKELRPLVVDAPIYRKKLERKRVIDGYQDPYQLNWKTAEDLSRPVELPYREAFGVPEDLETGRVRAVVSSDGCGECTGIDTVEVAAIGSLVTLIDVEESFDMAWIEPEFVIRPKIRKGRGKALLQFVINRHDINLEMGNNRRELEGMVAVLRPVLSDSLATVGDIHIYGMASADGPLALNTALAQNRAASARRWLVDRLDIRPEVQRLMTVGSRPEGWWPVYRAMQAGGHPDSLDVKTILTRYDGVSDDVQERYIRQLSCWPDIRSQYLQKDRKVEYTYSYVMRSFTTDDELRFMYRKRPDAFNEDELLRVASLQASDSGKVEVYRTLMTYFPQSQVAANNLAVLYLRSGQKTEARRVLDRLEDFSPETLNTLAASYVYAGDYERAVELLQDVELPEGRYNLGLLKARQRKLEEAYRLLKDYRDVNSAIVALSVERNAEAKAVMEQVDDTGPLAGYVRSLVAARLHDDKTFYRCLAEACRDEHLRRRAMDEPDFARYRHEETFRRLVEQKEEADRNRWER